MYCRLLNLGNRGEMRDTFENQIKLAPTRDKELCARAFMAWQGFRMVGWAMTFWPDADSYSASEFPNIHIFVDPEFRRNGVGTKLLKQAHRRKGELYVFPHDGPSANFFYNNIGLTGNPWSLDWFKPIGVKT